jgi:hypothetical protein
MTPEELFRGMESPALPDDLRGRVFSAVREAMPSPAPAVVDGLWGSRRLRFAWAGLVLALLAGHASLSFEAWSVRAPQAAPAASLTDLGLAEGSLPPTLARRLQNSSPRPRRLRLVDVWLDSTLTAWL